MKYKPIFTDSLYLSYSFTRYVNACFYILIIEFTEFGLPTVTSAFVTPWYTTTMN